MLMVACLAITTGDRGFRVARSMATSGTLMLGAGGAVLCCAECRVPSAEGGFRKGHLFADGGKGKKGQT